MSPEDSKRREALEPQARAPSAQWTQARLESLTGSQVKALLLVASEPLLPSPELSKRHAEVERLLVDMGAEADGSPTGILDTAMNADTSIQELTRLKDLAKALARDAEDRARLEAARLLYHVSVASAFLHHGAAISGRPRRKQQPLYDTLAETWTGHAIGELFRRMAANSPDE